MSCSKERIISHYFVPDELNSKTHTLLTFASAFMSWSSKCLIPFKYADQYFARISHPYMTV